MSNTLSPDEGNPPVDIDMEDGQPSRSEFNFLLGRMKTLEEQLSQQRKEEATQRVSFGDSVTYGDPAADNNKLSDAAAEGANTHVTHFRRQSLARIILRGRQSRRAHSTPQTSLDESLARLQLEESVVGLEAVDQFYDNFELPESVYTFLITEPILSTPFAVGCIAYVVSLACLALALKNELDNRTPDNPYAIAEVTRTVRVVQYLGVFIGVLMDDEIPTGLELIGKALEQKKEGDKVFPRRKVFFSSILRISIGAMFLTCLFFVVVQADNVLDIFFDMIALEFVESIDDVIYELCRRGFFSRRLKVAANKENVLQCSSSHNARRIRRLSQRFIRAFYFSCAIAMLVGLSIVTHQQTKGTYGCRSLKMKFGDGVWEDAWVELDKQCSVDADCNNTNQKCYIDRDGDGLCYESRLLIYSHFNGNYNQNGTFGQRPRYVETSKDESGDFFKSTIPAELKYCQDIKSWVLTHPKIRTSLNPDDANNKCNWLVRSERTEEFDLEKLPRKNWIMWHGQMEKEYDISVSCAECAIDADCNYFGECEDQKCECFPGRFGVFCEHETPCEVIRPEKDPTTSFKLVKDLDKDGDNIDFINVYGRPMYAARMQGKPYSVMRDGYPGQEEQYFEIEYPVNASAAVAVAPHKHVSPDDYSDDDFFEINNQSAAFQKLMNNYTFVLYYTGRRWYGQIRDPNLTAKDLKEEEYHAFWMNSFSGLGQEDNSTLVISQLTREVSPVNVDFFEMRRKNKVFEGGIFDDYSPFGVMIPLVEQEGAGFFHCNKPFE